MQLPTRKGPLLLLIAVVVLVPVAAFGVGWLARETAVGPPLATLELADEPRELTLPASLGRRATFWTFTVTDDAVQRRKADLLRYEIELLHDGKTLTKLSCDPFRSTIRVRDSWESGRREREYDMDDCEVSLPQDATVTLRARRVWQRQPEGFRFLRTELRVRP